MEQYRQCTCKVRLKRVFATIVAVEMQQYYIFWVCVYSLMYRARSVHAIFCYCGLSGFNFFYIIS
jgi:hypothetical protein